MRARQEMHAGSAHAQQRDQQRHEQMHAAADHPADQRQREQRDQDAGHQYDSLESRHPVQAAVDHVGEPLPGVPGRAGLRKRIQILCGTA